MTRSETGTRGDEDFGVMQKPVEARACQQRIAEEIRPLGGDTVAGEHNAALFVARIDDFVKVLRPRRLKGAETEIIKHQ